MINVIANALSGLTAATKKVEASASNVANLTTAGALDEKDGPKPYETLKTVQTSVADQDGNGQGVRARNIPKDPGFVQAYDPDSPFADENGYIGVPNTDLAEEAVNLKLAEITYKANLKTLQVAKETTEELLRTFDDRL